MIGRANATTIKTLAAAAALGAAVLAGPAAAAEPVTLSPAQMDEVTAGVLAVVLVRGQQIVFQRVFNLPTGSATFLSDPIVIGNYVLVIGVGPN